MLSERGQVIEARGVPAVTVAGTGPPQVLTRLIVLGWVAGLGRVRRLAQRYLLNGDATWGGVPAGAHRIGLLFCWSSVTTTNRAETFRAVVNRDDPGYPQPMSYNDHQIEITDPDDLLADRGVAHELRFTTRLGGNSSSTEVIHLTETDLDQLAYAVAARRLDQRRKSGAAWPAGKTS